MNEILRMREISKSFSGVEVLHSVDLSLNEGKFSLWLGKWRREINAHENLMGIEQPIQAKSFCGGRGQDRESRQSARAGYCHDPPGIGAYSGNDRRREHVPGS
jgi:ABC-type uncharacterized transport system ATPase subunit